jgi:hypothetical protein
MSKKLHYRRKKNWVRKKKKLFQNQLLFSSNPCTTSRRRSIIFLQFHLQIEGINLQNKLEFKFDHCTVLHHRLRSGLQVWSKKREVVFGRSFFFPLIQVPYVLFFLS